VNVVYSALSSSPGGCVEFYGITVLSSYEGLPPNTLCFVFELAREGEFPKYISNHGHSLKWFDMVGLFIDIAWALADGLHAKKILHGLIFLLATLICIEISIRITHLSLGSIILLTLTPNRATALSCATSG
jgi:hypothetical protein